MINTGGHSMEGADSREFREESLHYIWKNRLLKRDEFNINRTAEYRLVDGGDLVIISPGIHNHDAGPDFLEGEIIIDNNYLSGDIEIHKRSSDWYRHRHHLDPGFNSTILHITLDPDSVIFTSAGDKVPQFDISSLIPFHPVSIRTDSRFRACPVRDLNYLGDSRADILCNLGYKFFRERYSRIKNIISRYGRSSVLLSGLCRGLGYSEYKDIMEVLGYNICLHTACNIIDRSNTSRAMPELVRYFFRLLLHPGVQASTESRNFRIRPHNRLQPRLRALGNILIKTSRTGFVRYFDLIFKEHNLNRNSILKPLMELSLFKGRHNPGSSRWSEILGNFLLPYYYSISSYNSCRLITNLFFRLGYGEDISVLNEFRFFKLRQYRRFIYKAGVLELIRTHCRVGNCGDCPLLQSIHHKSGN